MYTTFNETQTIKQLASRRSAPPASSASRRTGWPASAAAASARLRWMHVVFFYVLLVRFSGRSSFVGLTLFAILVHRLPVSELPPRRVASRLQVFLLRDDVLCKRWIFGESNRRLVRLQYGTSIGKVSMVTGAQYIGRRTLQQDRLQLRSQPVPARVALSD